MLWWIALTIKGLALSYAAYDSVRARFWPGIGALVSAAYLTAARIASLLPSRPPLPLHDVLAETWWSYPCAIFVLSLGPMLFAFRAAGQLPEIDPRQRHLERAGFAFLMNTIFDAMVLVIIAVGLLLVARDP